MVPHVVTIFGGSGFLGRHLVRRLAPGGVTIRVAVRDPEAAQFLKPAGDAGQIVPVQANLRDQASVAAAVAGADTVVNLIGILVQSGRQSFAELHAEGAERAARAAAAAGVARYVQVSAIGADAAAPSAYARSKVAGEQAARSAFAAATIVRPSVVFGPEDDFFNRLAALARLLPVLPLYGHGFADAGATRFQPVYVGDVAEALARVLDDPTTAGCTYELGGPKVYSFRELMELVLAQTGRRRLLVPVPFVLGRLQAAFLELLPAPPLTRDQLRSLERDNVVSDTALSLADLAVAPTPVEAVLPSYLARFRRAELLSDESG